MNTKPRLTGEPVMRILCKKSESLVGYLYQWDNGDVQPAWFHNAMADVRYEPMDQDAERSLVNLRDLGRHHQGPSHLENA